MKNDVRPKKLRLDKLLVLHGLAPDTHKARALILARDVQVRDVWVDKADALFPPDVEIRIKDADSLYVSRGGLKLSEALTRFALDVTDLAVVDVGASTGGFTDCLLQAGARRVFAVDVGYGQLAWKLRADRRVTVIERTNIRYYQGEELDEKPALAVVDVSFISLKTVIPAVALLLAPLARILALIKPQFEVKKEEVGKNGVVKSPEAQRRVVEEIQGFCQSRGLSVEGVCDSPVLGPAGNREFFILVRKPD